MSVEADVLHGLQTLLTPTLPGPGTLFQLPPEPDICWALSLTRGPTDGFGRWGQGVLLLHTRGARSTPLDVHDPATAAVRALIAVSGATYGTTGINLIAHRSSIAGPDSSKRTVRTDLFDIDLDYQA